MVASTFLKISISIVGNCSEEKNNGIILVPHERDRSTLEDKEQPVLRQRHLSQLTVGLSTMHTHSFSLSHGKIYATITDIDPSAPEQY